MLLRLHSFPPHSRANGPGTRAVVWTQGCALDCPGCFNPQTHPAGGGQRVSVEALFARLCGLGASIEGVTLSGGEPLQQVRPLLELLRRVRRETSLSAVLFTGFRWEELGGFRQHRDLLANLDVLIAGRYEAPRRVARGLIGSANKTLHFLTDRYGPADFEALPEAEVFIEPGGTLIFSGIDTASVGA